MMRLSLFIVFWLTALIAHPGQALDGGVLTDGTGPSRDFTLTLHQEPATAEFGKPVLLVITVKHLPHIQLNFPKELPTQDNLRAVGPIQYQRKTLGADAGLAFIQEVWRIPLLPLDLKDIDTPRIEVPTNLDEPLIIDPMALAQRPVPPPSKEEQEKGFEGHAGPFVFMVSDERPYVFGTFAATTLVCLLLFLWFMMRRRLPELPKALVEQQPATPAIPPHVVALERLERLMAEGHLEKGEVKTFVTVLMNDILRSYLEGRYDFPAEKHTTRELVADLLKISDAGLNVQLVKDILETTDLVKFAKAEIPPQNAHSFANQVKALILATKEEPVEEAA